MNFLKLPKIGLRTLKTALAVFLCLVILPSEPFFACLTAVICMQDTVENSLKMGKNRAIGTIAGAIIGLIVMTTFKSLTGNIDGVFASKLITYVLISIGIILVIYSNNVFLKMPGAINVACISFLAVTTTHAYTDPVHYAVNRTLETLCGIVIAIIINKTINPPKK